MDQAFLLASSPEAATDAGPPAKAFLNQLASSLGDMLQSLAASGILRLILVSLAVVVGTAALAIAALWLFRRSTKAVREKAAIRDVHFRSWKVVSGDQIRDGILRILGSLRILTIATIVVGAAWGLSLVLAPGASALFFVFGRGAWLGLATFLLWIFALRAVRAAGHSLLAAIASQEKGIKPLKYKSFTILSAPIIKKGLVFAVKLAGLVSLLVSLAILVALILSYFSYTWSWSQAILSAFSSVIKPIFDEIVAYIPKFFFAAAIIVIARVLLRLLKAFFAEIEAGRLGLARFEREWASTTYKVLRLAVVALTFVMIFPYIPGSGSDAFRSVAVFLGVLLSLGSSSFVGNIMAGVSLTYMSPFRIGDRVRIGETNGDVIEKTLLVTRLRTIKNVVVTIPNSVVLAKEVENFSSRSLSAPLILHTSVTIGYEVPWREVHAALLSAAAAVDGLLAEPRPFVLQIALDNWSVNYELNASTAEPLRMVIIYSELHQAIQDAFAKAGIEIMTPSYLALRDGKASTIPTPKDGTVS